MTIPTIHLNGTSGQELLDQVLNACHSLNTALSALDNAAPNGRDYYTQGPAALPMAQNEHQARVTKVRGVLDEMQQLAEAIADGGHKAGGR